MISPIFGTEGEFLGRVADVYRTVVAESDPDEGTTKAEALAEAVLRLRDMVDAGDLHIPLDFALRRAVDRVDELDGRGADRSLARVMAGQLALDGTDLDVVVILGEGRRKPLRHIGDADLRAMDATRYRNLRNAQEAYSQWRDVYEPALAAAAIHGTIGAAFDSGAFGAAAA